MEISKLIITNLRKDDYQNIGANEILSIDSGLLVQITYFQNNLISNLLIQIKYVKMTSLNSSNQ